MPFDLPTFAFAAVVVFGAYVIFGLTAFGAALFTVPILSHLLPLEFVLPTCVLLDVAGALAVGGRITREADWGELRWMIPFAIAGAVVGVTLLVNLPRRAILTTLGIFLVAYAAHSLRQGAPSGLLSRGWAPVTGFIGGSMGTLLGIAAPPYAIYLARRIFDARAYRATLSNMVIVSTTTRALVFLAGGLMLIDRLAAFAMLLPFALAGIRLGTRISNRVSRAQLLRVVSVLLMLIGVSLLARALQG
jgi:uncharacterized protein